MVAKMVNIPELVPFYVNGTLSSEECALVERVLAEDPQLRDSARALARLRSLMQAQEPERSPGPLGRARLMRDIERQENARVEDSLRAVPPRRYSSPFPSVLAAAVVAGLFALGVGWFSQTDTSPYQLASGGSVAEVRGPVLTIAFRPDATEAEIAALLRELRLGIVAGPTALGLYRIQAGESADLTELAARLRAAPQVVESVGLP
jgi:anti-sigma factor RsiW